MGGSTAAIAILGGGWMWGGVRKPQTRDRQGSDQPKLDLGVEWSVDRRVK